MTNKEKAIQQAYGDYWEQVKDYTDSDGWFNRANLKYKDCLFLFNGNRDLYETNFKGYFRPKSLRGLENNNDWIKIQPEFYFPNEDVWVINLNGNKIPFMHDALKPFSKSHTHYQPIVKPKPPIY